MTKIIASYTGPSGVALVGQMISAIGMIIPFSNGGIGHGIVKYIAEYNILKRNKRSNDVINTSLVITLSCSILISITIFFLRKLISVQLFGRENLCWVFIVLSLMIPVIALGSSFLSILNGYKKVKEYAYVTAINALVFFCIVMILVRSFKFNGALLAIIFTQSSIFFVVLFFLFTKGIIDFRKVNFTFDKNIANKLFKYTLMGLTTAIMAPLSQILVRTYIIKNLSTVDAGYWEGVWRISDTYLSVITLSFSVYYLPRLSEISDIKELKREIVNTFLFAISIAALASIFIYNFRRLIILSLFTNEFIGMSNLFLFQLIGSVVKIASWTLGMIMWAKSLTRLFITTEIAFSLTFVIFSIVFLNNFGLVGVTYAYTLNYLIYLIFLLRYFTRWVRVKPITSENVL